MSQKLKTRFRTDLLIMPALSPLTGLDAIVTVKDLRSGQVFRFDQRQYFLCQAWNGQNTLHQVCQAFCQKFRQPLDPDDLAQFIQTLDTSGLLEPCAVLAAKSLSPQQKTALSTANIICSLPLSSGFLRSSVWVARQFQWLWVLLGWLAVPSLLMVLFVITHNWPAFRYDLNSLFNLPFVELWLSFHGTFLFLGLFTHFIQGLVVTHFGGRVSAIGMSLTLGVFPFFAIDLSQTATLPRSDQLRIYGTPLITRSLVLCLGTLLWYNTRLSGTSLHFWAILWMLAGLMGLLLEGSPLWLSNGYSWMVVYFRMPQLQYRARLFWSILLKRRPLPPTLSWRQQLLLWGFGLFSCVASIALFSYLALLLSHSLAELLTVIVGEAAQPLMIGLIVILFGRYLWQLRTL